MFWTVYQGIQHRSWPPDSPNGTVIPLPATIKPDLPLASATDHQKRFDPTVSGHLTPPLLSRSLTSS
jgi:hypothetical protein